MATCPTCHQEMPEQPGGFLYPTGKSLTPYFTDYEFCCRCCGRYIMPPRQLLDWLDLIRMEFDSPVIINSGTRCENHNRNVGGATASRHLKGDAADIVVKGVDPTTVYMFCDELIGSDGGVGKYNTFTHIDNRGTKARW